MIIKASATMPRMAELLLMVTSMLKVSTGNFWIIAHQVLWYFSSFNI